MAVPELAPAAGSPLNSTASMPSMRDRRGSTGSHRVVMKALKGTISSPALRAYQLSTSSGCIRPSARLCTMTGRSCAPRAKSFTSVPAKMVDSIELTAGTDTPKLSAFCWSMSMRSAASSSEPWFSTFWTRGSSAARRSSSSAVSVSPAIPPPDWSSRYMVKPEASPSRGIGGG